MQFLCKGFEFARYVSHLYVAAFELAVGNNQLQVINNEQIEFALPSQSSRRRFDCTEVAYVFRVGNGDRQFVEVLEIGVDAVRVLLIEYVRTQVGGVSPLTDKAQRVAARSSQ